MHFQDKLKWTLFHCTINTFMPNYLIVVFSSLKFSLLHILYFCLIQYYSLNSYHCLRNPNCTGRLMPPVCEWVVRWCCSALITKKVETVYSMYTTLTIYKHIVGRRDNGEPQQKAYQQNTKNRCSNKLKVKMRENIS